ncbi:MAG: tetratricopeptide repeat protein [Alphaproteobacteria bacterium]
MDFTVFFYTASLVAALLASSSYSHWGVSEVRTYAVPPFLEERGYSERLVTNQVVDSMRRIQVEVGSLQEASFVIEGDVKPIGEVASYFGVLDLLRAAEDMVGLEPAVLELEITQHGEEAHWRIRGDHAVRGYAVNQGDVPMDDPDALMDQLGLQVMSYVYPFEALSYHFIRDSVTNDYEVTIAAASELLLDCRRYQSWVCTGANLQSAHLLRGLAHLASDDVDRAFEDFGAASKMGSESAMVAAFYGDAFAAMQQPDAAHSQYERAKTLDSEVGDRFHTIGQGYAVAKNYRLADQRFRTAAALGAHSEEFLGDWGDSLYELGRYDQAIEKYRQAELADPDTELFTDRIDRASKARETGEAKPLNPKAPPVPLTPSHE